MKLKIKTEGLTGEALKAAEQFNAIFAGLPDTLSKEDLDAHLKTYFGETLTPESLKALAGQLDEKNEAGLLTIVKKQGEKINELIAKMTKSEGETKKSVKEWITDNKEKFEAIKANRSGSLSLKVADVTGITTGTSVPNAPANPFFPMPTDSGRFVDIRKPHLFILEYIDKGETTSAAILWTEEAPSTFGGALVTEGALKPLADQKAVRRVSNYKKVAARIIITEELEKDEPRLLTQFRRLFSDKVDRAFNYQILADIIAIAPGYVSTTLNGLVPNPDNFGAIAAGIAQCQSAQFQPDTLFLNPNDLWRMSLQKNTIGDYVIPPFVNISLEGMQYGNLKIVVTTQVSPGYFLLGEAKTYKVDIYEDYTLRIGFVNDDFAKNQYSAVGEIKFHSYIATNEVSGWFYSQFDTVKAAIATAPQA